MLKAKPAELFLTQPDYARRLVGVGGELGDGLGALGHGVLGQLAREHEANSSLDLSGGKSGLLVVSGQTRSLGGDAVEDVVDEGVHDGHASLGDAGVVVHLLEHLVDVRGVGLDSLLVLGAGCLLGRLDTLLAWGLSHFACLGWFNLCTAV